MKVMVIGGNQIKYFASRYYAFANKLVNGLTRNNHAVVRFFDRDVARLDNVLRSRVFGVKGANKELLQQAATLKPDLFLFIHADVIEPRTVLRLRENHRGAKFAQISIDAIFTPRNVKFINTKSHLMDATFVTTAGEGLKKISGGKPAYYIPNVTDPSIETGRAFDADCETDLFFACGSFEPGGHDPRKETLDAVREQLPDIKADFTIAGRKGGLWGDEYIEALSQSRCGLNLSRERDGPHHPSSPEDLYVYSSDRISHLTGNGILTFSHKKFGLDRLFTDDEMVFFDSNDDLTTKISHYLGNDDARRRVARNGWEKSHGELNERLAAQFIEDVLCREKLTHPYIWPTEKVI